MTIFFPAEFKCCRKDSAKATLTWTVWRRWGSTVYFSEERSCIPTQTDRWIAWSAFLVVHVLWWLNSLKIYFIRLFCSWNRVIYFAALIFVASSFIRLNVLYVFGFQGRKTMYIVNGAKINKNEPHKGHKWIEAIRGIFTEENVIHLSTTMKCIRRERTPGTSYFFFFSFSSLSSSKAIQDCSTIDMTRFSYSRRFSW